MKLSKTKTILTAIFFGGILLTNAQENARKGWDAPPPKSHISFGYGSAIPNSASKDAFFTNSSGIAIDYSVPLTKRGWGPNGNYLSLNIGGQYNFGGSGDPSVALPNGFTIAGQTSSSIAYKGVDPKSPGFFTFAGPQVNFNLSNKFTISPMLLAGYFSTTQKELSAVQTTQYNGQTLEYNLNTLPETKTSGFAITPKVRMQYMLTKNLGLFADASYLFGPKVETQLSNLVPVGNPNQQGQYEQQQLDNGTYVKGETKSTSYTALGLNVGLSFAFGGDKGWNGVTQANNTKTSTTCSCKAPVPFYNREYPSAGFVLPTVNPWPAYIPVSDLTSGKKIHFAFATGPCNPGGSGDPCYGKYTATVNGHSVSSSSVGSGSQTHIEIPISYLLTGPNTITVNADCGGSICTLTSSTVTIGDPPTPSPTAITLIKNCCTIIHGLHAGDFTGQSNFTMGGTASVGAVLEITSPSGIVYEPFVSGNSTACYSPPYTIKLLDASHLPFVTTAINGVATNTISYNRRLDFSCLTIRKIDLSIAAFAIPRRTHDWATESEIDKSLLMADNPNSHRLSTTFTNPKTKEVVTIKSLVEIDEKGDMYLIKVEEANSTLNHNNTPIQVLPQKKHSYVGHVTLLR